MAAYAFNAATNTEAVVTLFNAEIGLDPTEETKVADWVEQPQGAQKFGASLKLRKLPAYVSQDYTGSTTATRASLTYNQNIQNTVTVSATGRYNAVGIDRSFINQVIDDGNYRKGIKTQLMASLKEEVDQALFALGSSLSTSTSQADIDDAMIRTALGQLATNAKGKFSASAPKLLVVHPTELKNVWNVPAIKEYQIRGTIGAAVNAELNAYGLIWRESGNVLFSGGSYYNPLLLKDAWALCWNEKPHILDVQIDGLTENFIGYAEFGAAEWFDSSGVALVTT
jgi:hypothetical protein